MSKKEICFEDIRTKLLEWDEFSCKPNTPKYKEGHIFDEDKSVKWNRKEVKRLNDCHNEEAKILSTTKNKLYEDFKNTFLEYIIQETGVLKTKALKIYDYLYNNSYNLYDALNKTEELLDLFR